MATDRQVEANRRNAKMSTGPRTPAGKARSRQNALTHGLTAGHTYLLPGEDRAEFEEIRRAMFRHLAPDGPLETQLVERIVGLLWRLRRIPAFEMAVLEWIKQVEGKGNDDKGDGFMNRSLELVNDSTDDDRYSHASRSVLEIGRALEIFLNTDLSKKLGRYETDLQRHLSQMLKELRALQASRLDLSKHFEAPTQALAAKPATRSDQETLPAAGGRIIRRSLSAPGDFDHGVKERAEGSLKDFAGMRGVD